MKKRNLLALSMAMMLLCPAFGNVAKAMVSGSVSDCDSDSDDDFDPTRSGRLLSGGRFAFRSGARVSSMPANGSVSDDDDDDELFDRIGLPKNLREKAKSNGGADGDFDPTRSGRLLSDGRFASGSRVHGSGMPASGSVSDDDDDDDELFDRIGLPKNLREKAKSNGDADGDFDPMRSGRLLSDGRFASGPRMHGSSMPASGSVSDDDDDDADLFEGLGLPEDFDLTKSYVQQEDGKIVRSWKVHYSGDSSVPVNDSVSDDADDDFDPTRSGRLLSGGRFAPKSEVRGSGVSADGSASDDDDDDGVLPCLIGMGLGWNGSSVMVTDSMSDDDDDDECRKPTESPKKGELDSDSDDEDFDPTRSCVQLGNGRIVRSRKVHYSGDISVSESVSDHDDGLLDSSVLVTADRGQEASVVNKPVAAVTASKPAEKAATKEEKAKPVAAATVSKPAKKVVAKEEGKKTAKAGRAAAKPAKRSVAKRKMVLRKTTPISVVPDQLSEKRIRSIVRDNQRDGQKVEYSFVYALPIFAGISGEKRVSGEKVNAVYAVEEPRQGVKNPITRVYIQFVKKLGVESVTVEDYAQVVSAILSRV